MYSLTVRGTYPHIMSFSVMSVQKCILYMWPVKLVSLAQHTWRPHVRGCRCPCWCIIQHFLGATLQHPPYYTCYVCATNNILNCLYQYFTHLPIFMSVFPPCALNMCFAIITTQFTIHNDIYKCERSCPSQRIHCLKMFNKKWNLIWNKYTIKIH